ncbi:MAG: adenine phosphoribosyltransferase [Phycisphaerales bacterium]|jgi:adenine phosphoribosyltransferase|nr:adenine phosphoribosyltransferase [Planctomycetaceae bacterium]MDP6157842.1 adenine phosphoribosyltransferase [Phycisphaerales bacterium]MDP6312574.1 adenine phosphoribosyltransferase [Phycisphaerales bacterium]MDP7087774.1 adenine phosphoribosyltransferase [Phycisphaerales bacterium]MDP7188353.1 adenine phosphoribosyltransferase [Phycisphaerales bacterium]|tara:strand:+ start:436 stop:954 length:519 start_codon:yes stop_codon:yes gene_type:complete
MPERLRALVRDIPDYPHPGIVFRDITPLLRDRAGLALAAELMVNPFRNCQIDVVVGAESRGFIFGTLLARALNAGFVPIRKPGKLPGETCARDYDLEYGSDTLEIHTDAIEPGQRVLLVDDLIATGGTMLASRQLIEALGGELAGITVLIELAALNGGAKQAPHHVHSVLQY